MKNKIMNMMKFKKKKKYYFPVFLETYQIWVVLPRNLWKSTRSNKSMKTVM